LISVINLALFSRQKSTQGGVILLLFGVLCSSGRVDAGQVSIAVSSNFLSSAKKIASQFEATTGHKVQMSSASTGKLYAQILNGAPYDIFLAANKSEPQRLEEEGRVLAGSRFTYARGILALFSIQAEKSLTIEQVNSSARIAIANPLLAPYGVAADQVLRQYSKAVEPRNLIRAENVGQVFLYTVSQNVDMGFVALSQIIEAYDKIPVGKVWIPNQKYYTPIEQQAVLLKRAKDNAAAHAFYDFLQSVKTQALIHKMGYAE